MNGDVGALNLKSLNEPDITFYPDMLEGDLVLSHATHTASSDASDHSTNTAGSSASSAVSSSSETVASSSEAGSSGRNSSSNINSGEDGEGSGVVTFGANHSGVIWNVSALQQSVSGESMMDWTIFPSTGMLLPGERCVRCDEVRHVLIGARASRAGRRCRYPISKARGKCQGYRSYLRTACISVSK